MDLDAVQKSLAAINVLPDVGANVFEHRFGHRAVIRFLLRRNRFLRRRLLTLRDFLFVGHIK